MKIICTLALLFTAPIALLAQRNCTTPIVITPGIYNAAFVSGSTPPPVTCGGNGQNNNPTKGIWYSYTPTADGRVTVSTDVPGYTNQDTRINIIGGSCGEYYNCFGGDDDSGPNNTSIATWAAQAGFTYYIVFDNNWSEEPFTFSLAPAAPETTPFSLQSINLEGNKWAIVDLNGDYLDDIVAPDGWYRDRVHVLYQNNDDTGFNAATLTTPTVPNPVSWSLAAGDFDGNGYNDLLYGNGTEASLLLANSTGTAFTGLTVSPYIFSQRTNFVDINNDGNLDAFVCHDLAPNCYFLNDGTGGNSFHQGGLGDYPSGGNYGSIWVDYDNDGDSDLFIAKCRGGIENAAIDELHRNNGDGTFTNVADSAGFSDFHQSWSSAWADFDGDGYMDVFIGGSSDGHKLMHNNTDGTFTNVTANSGFDVDVTTSAEHVAHDFDNDGFVDILNGGRKIMHNNGDMTFTPIAIPAYSGPIGDINNDGFLDILNSNSLYVANPNGNNWIKILLQGTTSNRNGIGARVEILGTGNGWTKQIRDVRSGDGFRYMSSLNVHFGLGQTQALDMVVVKWPSGTVDYILNPAINQPLMVTEGAFPLSRLEVNNNKFILYPNPATEILTIKSSGDFTPVKANIYSTDGKLAIRTQVTNFAIPVQQLAKGTYILILQAKDGKQHTSKFIKG